MTGWLVEMELQIFKVQLTTIHDLRCGRSAGGMSTFGWRNATPIEDLDDEGEPVDDTRANPEFDPENSQELLEHEDEADVDGIDPTELR